MPQASDTPAAPVVAEMDHVIKVYGSGDTRVVALNDLSMAVRRGDYLAMMGSSVMLILGLPFKGSNDWIVDASCHLPPSAP